MTCSVLVPYLYIPSCSNFSRFSMAIPHRSSKWGRNNGSTLPFPKSNAVSINADWS